MSPVRPRAGTKQDVLVILFLAAGLMTLTGCGRLGNGDETTGWPDIDLGAAVEVYKSTPERDLHVHLFRPTETPVQPTSAVLLFHGGGYRTTRVHQFQHQAKALAEAGILGVVVEYRVTADGTSRMDAILDGGDAYDWLTDNSDRFGVDPARIVMAGASAGGHLAVHASAPDRAAGLVLFNPAVGATDGTLLQGTETLVFHSRTDTIVPFASAVAFCDATVTCRMSAYDEGDHGFFNDEPALTETTAAMIAFVSALGT